MVDIQIECTTATICLGGELLVWGVLLKCIYVRAPASKNGSGKVFGGRGAKIGERYGGLDHHWSPPGSAPDSWGLLYMEGRDWRGMNRRGDNQQQAKSVSRLLQFSTDPPVDFCVSSQYFFSFWAMFLWIKLMELLGLSHSLLLLILWSHSSLPDCLSGLVRVNRSTALQSHHDP